MSTFSSAPPQHLSPFTITIGDEKEAVDCLDLANFLYYFRATYVAFLIAQNDVQAGRVIMEAALGENREQLFHILNATVEENRKKLLQRRVNAAGANLEFTSISMNSPITFQGVINSTCVAALSAAVAFGGGEADLQKLEFKVNGIGPSLIEFFKIYVGQHQQPNPTSLPPAGDDKPKIEPPAAPNTLPNNSSKPHKPKL